MVAEIMIVISEKRKNNDISLIVKHQSIYTREFLHSSGRLNTVGLNILFLCYCLQLVTTVARVNQVCYSIFLTC